jgi:tape measure domain-containing protein
VADNKEFYRLDLVIGTDGVEETERAVKAMDKLLQQTQRRAAALGKAKITPSASLKDKATASADKVTRTMNRVDRIVAKPEARLVDHVTSAAGKIGSTLTGLTRKTWRITVGVKNLAVNALSGIKNTMFSLPSMLAAGGAAYGGVVAPLNLAGQMEQANIAFETMLKSATKAKAFLLDLQDFANKTPFEFPELRDSSKRLLAFGFDVKRIIPMMTAIGNASSGLGLGSEGIERVVTALGQMKAKGRIQGDEILQLTEAGIPAIEILAKKMKVTQAEYLKLQEKGLVPAEQAINALIEGMNERFPDMMAKQSKSLMGLWSTIKDTFSSKILFRWGEGIRLGIQPRIQKLVDWIDQNEKTIQHWGASLQKTATKAADWVADKFEKVMKLGDDPAFQNADFFGKVGIVWDTVIGQSFSDWMSSGGKNTIDNISSSIGTALGGGLKGFILGALGLMGGSEESKFGIRPYVEKNSAIDNYIGGLESKANGKLQPWTDFSGNPIAEENPYVEAGKIAGQNFFKSFLEALDPGEIVNKLGGVIWDANNDAMNDPSGGNTLKALGIDLAAIAGGGWLFNKIGGGKIIDLGKRLFGKGTKATTVATEVAESATKAVTGGAKATAGIEGSAEGLSRMATYGKKAGWLSKTWGAINGPLTELATFDLVDILAYSAGDFLFGHEKGQKYSKPGIIKNPLKLETYQDYRPGVLKRLYNWANGVDGTPEPTISNYAVSPFNNYPEVFKPIPGYQSKSISSLKSGDDFSIRIPDEQINQIVTPLNDLKKEITINVNMPPGLVNMTVQKDEIDVDSIVSLTGQRLRDALRAAQQNIK